MSSRTKRRAESPEKRKKSKKSKKDSDVESSEGEAIDDDELAFLKEEAAEIVTSGRRTRGNRVDYTKVAPIPGDDDDDDDEEEERPKKKTKKPAAKPAAKKASSSKKSKKEESEEESAEESDEEESAEESEVDEKPKKKIKKKKQVDSDDDDDFNLLSNLLVPALSFIFMKRLPSRDRKSFFPLFISPALIRTKDITALCAIFDVGYKFRE
ncbi:unnamed protein product [Peniophora sp. CBMAI 1063]|nr:unnamed protein product [Peniophora sp. CBMAI 1063]